MRTATFILPMGMTLMLLGCGILDGGQEAEESAAEGPSMSIAMVAPPPSLYAGDSLIEEKILESSVVVRATMTSLSSEVVTEADGKHSAVLKFNLDVGEYLKGTGPSSIVAVWVDGRSYDTSDEANAAKAIILAERDGQWDDREAIVFLYGVLSGLGASLDAELQLADHFLLYVGDPFSPDDFYSLHSRANKRWLPAAVPGSSTSDSREFLLDVPPSTETITLGNLKRRITEVTTEFNGGDGSEAYRDCVLEKYKHIRNQRNWPGERGTPYTLWSVYQSLVSGRSAGTVLDQREAYGGYPDIKMPLWLEGRDSALFDTADGASTTVDTDGDGEYDTIKYDEMVRLARPVPAGEYKFDLKETWPAYAVCGFVISNEWTVTVNGPPGTLHEAFFDPVTDGTAVAADDANGVLKPASFTDATGATAAIQRIAWEAGAVKLKLTPHTGIADHVVDFITLDGSVPLSLGVADATVDTADHTLSWTVASQPWEDGEQLMLRIREKPCSNGTVVANPSANPGLVADCKTLLGLQNELAGTATLNWSADLAIADWDGVTTGGTPSRVTKVELDDEELAGTIPGELGSLTELTHLDLSDNSLTGDIPAELGQLHNLEEVRLSGNSLTGCIPPALRDIATNDLDDLGLPDCTE